MQKLFKLFGSIQKVEEQEDGTIMVFGVASSESRDAAGELVRAAAMRDALPDYSRFPALREMHQPMAAGKVIEADVDEDGVTHIAAHVVDPTAIVKVRTGVYAGFSIGGKVMKRDASDRTIITKIRLIEISLVDSPCNPDAVLSVWKADIMTTEFKPASADVIARAKLLAKAAGTQRFKDFLFEAGQELVSEHLIEKGVLEPPAESETIEAAALTEDDATATAVEEAETASDVVAETADEAAAAVETAEAVVEEAPAAVAAEPDEGEHGGEAAAENDEIAAAAQPDPAAALTDALSKAGEAIEAAAPPATTEAPASPFADLGAVATALKSIGIGLAKSDVVAEGGSFEVPGPLAKGMYEVSRFADLLCSFACVQRGLAWEAENEGDASPIPEALANAIADLGNLLVQLAQEEVAELVASLKRSEIAEVVEIIYAGDGIELAEQIVDLVKADETLMAAADERLTKAAPPAAIEPAPAGDDAEKSARITELESENERLGKSLADAVPAIEELTKRFTDTIESMSGEIADLRKRFEDEPLAPKTAGTTRAVAKSQDSSGGAGVDGGGESVLSKEQIDEAWKALSQQEKGELLIRVALANPGQIRLPLSAAA